MCASTHTQSADYFMAELLHNKFLLPALAEAIYGSFYKAENEILKPLTIDKGRKGRERQCSYRYRQ